MPGLNGFNGFVELSVGVCGRELPSDVPDLLGLHNFIKEGHRFRFYIAELVNADDVEFSRVCEQLLGLQKEFAKLREQQCNIVVTFNLLSADIWFTRENLRSLSDASIGLNVLFAKHAWGSQNLSVTGSLMVPEPILWYSQADEGAFYNAIHGLDSVLGIKVVSGKLFDGIPNQIELLLSKPKLHEDNLRDLIGLLFRYDVDMNCLRNQLTDENSSWFKQRDTYWYKKVFGTKK